MKQPIATFQKSCCFLGCYPVSCRLLSICLQIQAALSHAVKGEAAEQVGQHFHLSAAGHDGAFQHADAVLGAQAVEVLQGAPVDIGGVVPLIGHALGHGHVSAQCDLQAVFPITEIGEGDDGLFGDTGEVAQDGFGVLHGLDGLAQYDDVKAGIAKVGESLFQVGLYDVYAAFYRCLYAVGVYFYAVTGAVFAVGEGAQQFAVAAA